MVVYGTVVNWGTVVNCIFISTRRISVMFIRNFTNVVGMGWVIMLTYLTSATTVWLGCGKSINCVVSYQIFWNSSLCWWPRLASSIFHEIFMNVFRFVLLWKDVSLPKCWWHLGFFSGFFVAFFSLISESFSDLFRFPVLSWPFLHTNDFCGQPKGMPFLVKQLCGLQWRF